MAVFCLGDTHFGAGVGDEEKLLCLEAKPEDFAIICGDAGFVWYGDDAADGRDKMVLDTINALGFTVCFIDGNHENHHALNLYPVVEFHGGKAHKLRDNVYHLMRGEIFSFEGKTYWTFGGAASVDKIRRTPGISWWPEEVPSMEEMEHGLETLASHGNKVDYIITHQAPKWVNEILYRDNWLDDRDLQNLFDIIYLDNKFEAWFCGHHHMSKQYGNLYILYNNIFKIG